MALCCPEPIGGMSAAGGRRHSGSERGVRFYRTETLVAKFAVMPQRGFFLGRCGKVGSSLRGSTHEAARVHHAARQRGGKWPLAAGAQQSEGMRRIGVLGGFAENDPEMKARLAGFRQGLERLGWSEGRNVRIHYRFAPAGTGQEQALAKTWSLCNPT